MNPTHKDHHNVSKPGRRTFLAGAAGAASATFLNRQQGTAAPSPEAETTTQAIDFNQSYGHYFGKESNVWVRVQLECRCEIFDRAKEQSEEYLLSVRTQTGLRTDPLSDIRDPGYDFWFIFSDRFVYIRRELASSYGNSSSRVPFEKFNNCGWHLHRAPAVELTDGVMIREALREWKPVVARTVFTSSDGMRGFSIEYPVKWADGNTDNSFRVETGPVVLLDPERVEIGKSPELDDFQWAYLDYRSLDKTKVFLEQPTPVLSGTHWQYGGFRNQQLTPEQRESIEQRLYSGWEPPIGVDDLKTVFMRNHYSTADQRTATTQLYSFA